MRTIYIVINIVTYLKMKNSKDSIHGWGEGEKEKKDWEYLKSRTKINVILSESNKHIVRYLDFEYDAHD